MLHYLSGCGLADPRSFEQIVVSGCNSGDMLYFSAHAFYSQGFKRKADQMDGGEERHDVWITTKELEQIIKRRKTA